MTKFLTKTGAFSITQESTDGALDTKSIILTYDSDIVYPRDSIVEFKGALYKANTVIDSAEYPFEEGFDSEQWTKLSGGGGVTFTDSEGNFPKNPSKGDEVYITEDGTVDGKILQRWIYSGAKWVLTDGGIIISATVLDNAIANSLTITETGRYIVPDSDSAFNQFDSEFGGKANLYADFNGITFSYSTPDSDDTVFITTGVNTGQLWKYGKGKWTEAIGSGVELNIFSWSITKSYFAGDMVIYNGNQYQANGTIPVNNAFSVGVSGATWRQIGLGGVIAEFGEVVLPANISIPISNALPQTVDVVSFTLPTAGTWEVSYVIRTEIQSDASFSTGFLTNSSNVVVPNSAAIVSFFNRVDNGDQVRQASATQTVRITTTGAAVYKLRAFASGNAFATTVFGSVDPHGATKVFWKKISGLAPITGQVTAYGESVLTNGSNIAVGATHVDLPGGSFTIPTPGVWEVTYHVRTITAVASGYLESRIVNSSGAVVPNSTTIPGFAPGIANFQPVGSQTVRIVTTTANEVFRLQGRAFLQAITISGDSKVAWKQLGTTSASGFLGVLSNEYNVANTYASGTIVVRNSLMYQANANVPAGTVFVEGTTGATWKQIGAGVIADYVESTDGVTTRISLTTAFVQAASVTIPSTGRWDIKSRAFIEHNGGASTYQIRVNGLAVQTGNAVDGTTSLGDTYFSGALEATWVHAYFMNAALNAGDVVSYWIREQNAAAALHGVQGQPKIYARKVAGFVPTTGTMTAHHSTTLGATLPGGGVVETDLASPTFVTGNIPFSNGVWTLTAGVTYDLFSAILYDAGGTSQGNGDISGAFVDATTNLRVGNQTDATTISTLFATRGISRPGTNRFTYTPTTNQTIKYKILYQGSAGSVSVQTTIRQIGTTNTAGFTGAMGNEWNIANSYQSGTIVVKDSLLYQANSFIPAGTAFTAGISGTTWKMIGEGHAVSAEFGEATVNGIAVSTTGTISDLATFTLPTAGTFEVTYYVRGRVAIASSYITAQISNTANTPIDGSYGIIGFSSTNSSFDATTTVTVRISTKGPETYKLRAAFTLLSSSQGIVFGTGDTNGGSKVVWKKISGFVPATGAVTDFIYVRRSGTDQAVTAISDIVLNEVVATNNEIAYNSTTGVFTLKAGVTYDLSADVGMSNVTNGLFDFAWVDAVSNTELPITRGMTTPAKTDSTFNGGAATGTYTPSTNQTIKLRAVFVSGTCNARANYSYATIKQLGTTNTTGFTGSVQNSWSILNSYESGTLVLKDDFFYQANAYIAAGTAFLIGTTGPTWKMVNQQAAEGSSVSLANNITINSLGTSNISTFTLPTAGTWEVTYTVTAQTSANSGAAQAFLTNAADVIVPNSGSYIVYLGGSVVGAGASSRSVFITTNGSENYTLKVFNNGAGSVSIFGNVTSTINGGGTGVTFKKISGFLPLQKKVFTERITIGATTTAPTKPTTMVKDFITLIDDNTGWCEVIVDYLASNAAGAAIGNGTYLISLPAGYSFDALVHPPESSTGTSADTALKRVFSIEAPYDVNGSVYRTTDNSTTRLSVFPHSATQFKLCFPDGSWAYLGSNYYQLTNAQRLFARFKFKKA